MKGLLNDTNRSSVFHSFVDISTILASNEAQQYVCEDCGIPLLLYPKGQLDNPYSRGTFYICKQCHVITDSSMKGMQHEDKIKPLDIAIPSFVMVPEKKGSELLFDPEYGQPIDPEPQEEERLKAQGCTILYKQVIAKSDF